MMSLVSCPWLLARNYLLQALAGLTGSCLVRLSEAPGLSRPCHLRLPRCAGSGYPQALFMCVLCTWHGVGPEGGAWEGVHVEAKGPLCPRFLSALCLAGMGAGTWAPEAGGPRSHLLSSRA